MIENTARERQGHGELVPSAAPHPFTNIGTEPLAGLYAKKHFLS